MWKLSSRLLQICTSESLTICFFRVEEVDFYFSEKCKSQLNFFHIVSTLIFSPNQAQLVCYYYYFFFFEVWIIFQATNKAQIHMNKLEKFSLLFCGSKLAARWQESCTLYLLNLGYLFLEKKTWLSSTATTIFPDSYRLHSVPTIVVRFFLWYYCLFLGRAGS